MVRAVGSVCISLGSVVLDRPDRSGRFIVKDLAGGWAYLVADADGDNRFRGQGCCEGGMEVALRCAFLAAIHRVPDCGKIRIQVSSRAAHQAMVQLASEDPAVEAAIGGRAVEVTTRPEEVASFQVRSAAEQAASASLRLRERAEWQSAGQLTDESAAAAQGSHWTAPESPARRRAWNARPPAIEAPAVPAVAAAPAGAVQRLVNGVQDGLAAAGVIAPRRVTMRKSALNAWLRDVDTQVTNVSTDLRDVGG